MDDFLFDDSTLAMEPESSLMDDPFFADVAPVFDIPTNNDILLEYQPEVVMTTEEIQAIMNEAVLPTDMVAQSALDASRFFGIPDPNAIIPLDQTCMVNWMKNSFFDDVIGFNQDELIGLGITTKNGVDLVFAHEMGHRLFQDTKFDGVLDGAWEHELAADYMAGIRAGIQNINTEEFEAALSGPGAYSHPSGNLRADFINEGKEFVEEWRNEHNGVDPTLEDCISNLGSELNDYRFDIIAARTSLEGLGVDGLYGDSFFDIALNKSKEFFTKMTA